MDDDVAMDASRFIRESPGKGFVCTESPEKRFRLKQHAIRHAKDKHTGELKVECTKCGKSHRKDHMARHLKSCQGPGPSLHCALCKKDFASNSHLLRHQRLHRHDSDGAKSPPTKRSKSDETTASKPFPLRNEGDTPVFPEGAPPALKVNITDYPRLPTLFYIYWHTQEL